jgi:hypothetical protein
MSDWILWRGQPPPKQETSKAQPSEKKKWRMNSHKKGAMWPVDPLLGNYRETTIQQPLLSNNSTNELILMATREYSSNGRDDFYAVSRCYKKDQLAVEVSQRTAGVQSL